MLKVQISHPANDTSAIHGQPLTVSGRATDEGGVDPIAIEHVTVQVDNDPPVPTKLTRSQNGKQTFADFTTPVIITGAQGPHSITATATTYAGVTASASVTVFLGPVYQADTPALLLDVQLVGNVDPTDDASVHALLVEIQKGLQPLSDVLASNGMLIAGPNLQAIPAPDRDTTVLRLGLWIEPDGFPVLRPTGDLVLPVLSDPAAAASFALVPLLPRPDRTSWTDAPLAVFIAATGIQKLADAALANSNNGYVTSVPVAMDPPSTVITRYNGAVDGAGFTVRSRRRWRWHRSREPPAGVGTERHHERPVDQRRGSTGWCRRSDHQRRTGFAGERRAATARPDRRDRCAAARLPAGRGAVRQQRPGRHHPGRLAARLPAPGGGLVPDRGHPGRSRADVESVVVDRQPDRHPHPHSRGVRAER